MCRKYIFCRKAVTEVFFLVEVKNLTKEYGKKIAVDQISFEMEKGVIYGLLGSNGAGKSTTMNLITGYLAPTEGEILIGGYDLQK